MKKVKIQKGCLWLNGQLFKMGAVVEVEDDLATELTQEGTVVQSEFVSNKAVGTSATPQNTKNNKNTGGKEEATTLPPLNLTGKSK